MSQHSHLTAFIMQDISWSSFPTNSKNTHWHALCSSFHAVSAFFKYMLCKQTIVGVTDKCVCDLSLFVVIPECVLEDILVGVFLSVWPFHTWAPPHNAVEELVGTASWQSAFSSCQLMACWWLLLMRLRSPSPVRAFVLSTKSSTLTACRKGGLQCCEHTYKWGYTTGLQCLCVFI